MIKKTIKIPIYEGMVNLLIGDIEESAKHMDEYYKGLDIQSCISSFTEGYFCVIETFKTKAEHLYILIKPDSPEKVIYHESLHATYKMLDVFGIEISLDNHESLAYLQGYIAEQIIKLLKKIK